MTLVGVVGVAVHYVVDVLTCVINRFMATGGAVEVIGLALMDVVVLGGVEDAHHQ